MNSPEIRHGADMASIYEAGRHMEAFMAMQQLYTNRIRSIQQRDGCISMLDYGTGKNGVARNISEPRLKQGDELALYDPFASIDPPFGQSRIIGQREVFNSRSSRPFTLISIAFVLCLLEPQDARTTLVSLREAHPEAEFIIVDYMLKGRESVADVLRSNHEMAWRKKMGDAEFIRTHTRFDALELCNLLSSAALPCAPHDVRPLDTLGIRSAAVISPAQEYYVAY